MRLIDMIFPFDFSSAACEPMLLDRLSCLANATRVVERVLPIWVVTNMSSGVQSHTRLRYDYSGKEGESDESLKANEFGVDCWVVCSYRNDGEQLARQ